MAQVTIRPVAGQNFTLEVDTGSHKLFCDQPVAAGGADQGPNPKDFLAAAIGSCAAQTILFVAPRRKWDIQELCVKVAITYPNGASADPHISEDIEVKGNLSQSELDAIKRVAEKCPVYKLVFGSKTVAASVTKL
jgi:putative redox protein